MINKVFVCGNITRQIDVATTTSGTSVISFGIAVNDRKKNSQTGEWEDVPNFFECVMYGTRAESLSKYLEKGMRIVIEGKLRYSSWTKDGQKRSKVEIVIDDIVFMNSKSQSQQQTTNYPQQQQTYPQNGSQQPMRVNYPQDQYGGTYPNAYQQTAQEDIPFN